MCCMSRPLQSSIVKRRSPCIWDILFRFGQRATVSFRNPPLGRMLLKSRQPSIVRVSSASAFCKPSVYFKPPHLLTTSDFKCGISPMPPKSRKKSQELTSSDSRAVTLCRPEKESNRQCLISREIKFGKPVKARYIRFVATSPQDKTHPWASLAELSIIPVE